MRICNCGHNKHSHGGLVLSNGAIPTHCVFGSCECDAFTPIALTHKELCRLGQIFHASERVNLLGSTDARIAEWLKDRLGEVEPPKVEPSPLTAELIGRWQTENGSLQAIRKEGNGR